VPPPIPILFDSVLDVPFDVRESSNLLLLGISKVPTSFDENDGCDERPVGSSAKDEEPE
jgi:hypothetical protein